ncbi:hypothetical protein PHLGIDRAFT_15765 [Phlebiopsis gigantea 11061_1 CR5-6]|uniref:Uncharacterized protein n=1 Tax=Phlebiopsis gigantea (strain 11061_1 CR5-6) TaxID=745531 RepID=A0A0C3PDZ1_PHLG1|nr:hypothetical protein PHLGIDRAFT_15765 [Phlebiopsis gigantea 11061_1 CR5-6]
MRAFDNIYVHPTFSPEPSSSTPSTKSGDRWQYAIVGTAVTMAVASGLGAAVGVPGFLTSYRYVLGSGGVRKAPRASSGPAPHMPTQTQHSREPTVVSEWREGLDRVVEVQRGPAEDVEVEVQKNFYAGRLRACDLRHHPCTALEQRLRGGRDGEEKRAC